MKHELAKISEVLGEDVKYLQYVPVEFYDYALTILDDFKVLLGNLKYFAKYTYNMTDEETDELLKQRIHSTFVQSEKAKAYNASQVK